MTLPTYVHFLILLAIAIVSALSGVAVRRSWDKRLRSKPRKMELIVVNTHKPDDQSIRGYYYERGPEWIVLIEAAVLDGDGVWREVMGQVVVPLPSISWIQKVAAAPTKPSV